MKFLTILIILILSVSAVLAHYEHFDVTQGTCPQKHFHMDDCSQYCGNYIKIVETNEEMTYNVYSDDACTTLSKFNGTTEDFIVPFVCLTDSREYPVIKYNTTFVCEGHDHGSSSSKLIIGFTLTILSIIASLI